MAQFVKLCAPRIQWTNTNTKYLCSQINAHQIMKLSMSWGYECQTKTIEYIIPIFYATCIDEKKNRSWKQWKTTTVPFKPGYLYAWSFMVHFFSSHTLYTLVCLSIRKKKEKKKKNGKKREKKLVRRFDLSCLFCHWCQLSYLRYVFIGNSPSHSIYIH